VAGLRLGEDLPSGLSADDVFEGVGLGLAERFADGMPVGRWAGPVGKFFS
jgi:hypothetical protein